jgi:hypothetical protein
MEHDENEKNETQIHDVLSEKQAVKEELIRRISQLKSKRDNISKQNKRLEELTAAWIHRYNQVTLQKEMQIDQYDQLFQRKASLEERILKLSEIDVLSDVVYISHRGFYATVNGLRLAMCTSPPMVNHTGNSIAAGEQNVPWHEINAAIGMLALLVQTFQIKLQIIHRSKFLLIPRGSTTKISHRQSNQQWDLFYQPSTFQFFARRNWNTAINILGFCILEVAQEMKSRSSTFSLPFPIENSSNFDGNRLGDIKVAGIEMAYNGDNPASWTKCMRYMAVNLKIIQAAILDLTLTNY